MALPLTHPAAQGRRLPAHEAALLQDVIDALWLEQLFDFRSHCALSVDADGAATLAIRLDAARDVLLRGAAGDGPRPILVGALAPQLRTATGETWLRAEELVLHLQQAAWWQDRSGRFLHFFRLSQRQALADGGREDAIVEALRRAPSELTHWEVLSCLKDRPFHPLARAKEWDGSGDVAAYLPTAMAPFAPFWLAVPRARLTGPGADTASTLTPQPIAAALLDEAQLARLRDAARKRQAGGDAWLWLPVHPWQWRRLQMAAAGLVDGCVVLGGDFGVAAPTASLRSLALPARPQVHVKLSLSVNTLGAIRTLPPRYLMNAIAAAACLERLRANDAWLDSHLLLCDESLWCAMRTGDGASAGTAGNAELIGNPGELACLVRRYPALPHKTLIPMAALPVCLRDGSLPVFEHLLGADAGADHAWRLFADIARLLIGVGLRCIGNGVMPEMHGQNIVMVCDRDRVEALLLRDHDTLRLCPALMRRRGVAVPQYQIDRATPNTLELADVPQLLAYFQTLAIEVNLYAALAALARRYAEPEARGWRIVRAAVEAALDQAPMDDGDRLEVRRLLLEAAQWPFKQVLAPLLARKDFGTGMPSSMGAIANPLLATGG